MREHSEHTRWVYADNPLYAFHARLPMPPELAVVTPKRFWSGQITVEDIVSVCRSRQAELLLLKSGSMEQTWEVFVKAGYSVEYHEGNYALYVANTK